jgi:hypothetical protein
LREINPEQSLESIPSKNAGKCMRKGERCVSEKASKRNQRKK